MRDILELEINELHTFFQQWFNGEIPQSNLVFQRFTTVLHPRFLLITPEGKKYNKSEIGKQIWDAYGSRNPQKDPFTIWIENYTYLGKFDTIFLVNYEEWQIQKSVKKGRVSTAIFEKSNNDHNNVRWILVHETWLD